MRSEPRTPLREMIPRGATGILDFLKNAAEAGWREAEVMTELHTLRREGAISFDGRTIHRPARRSFGERHTPKSRRNHDPDAGWFRIGMPGRTR